ncbi:hypothetical protein QBC42DRAFT_290743 [Cladorrhinum samala]|uniref:Uncharacterized protein n=1 Tax=Cladorrhinum samala TaxID=585594 RepID=A0AAV9HBU9_9PEZI|nr:hypothetical protein QBC42DRAFT_290743 [Cladorrhinum samala]
MEGSSLRKIQSDNVAEEDMVEQDIFEKSDNESSGGGRVGDSGNAPVCENDSEEGRSWEDDCWFEDFSKGGFGEARDDIRQDAADDDGDDDGGGEGVGNDGNATDEDFKDVTDEDEEDDGGAKTNLHPSLVRLICDMLTMRAEQCRGAINVPALRKELDILACNDLVNLLKFSPMPDENDTNQPSLIVSIQLEANLKRLAILRYTEPDTSKRILEDSADERTEYGRWSLFHLLVTIWITSAILEDS